MDNAKEGKAGMKVLIAGEWQSEIYEESLYRAFKELGVETDKFSWYEYFKGFQIHRTETLKGSWLKSAYYRAQNKFLLGPAVHALNSGLARRCREFKPDTLFLYRAAPIYPSTMRSIRRMGIKIVGWNNDDPFGIRHPWYLWRFFRRSIPLYNHLFSFRACNIPKYRAFGCQSVSLWRAAYIEKRCFPIENLGASKYRCDVLFAGHFEDDGREEYLKAALKGDYQFKLVGPQWERSRYYNQFLSRFGPIEIVYDDYNLLLNSCKIALVFFSKLNNDTYTIRSFEIPATGRFMLSQYTEDMDSMFKEGVEAEYFRSIEEMTDKIEYYLKHDDARERIARSGRERLLRDGHEITDRAREVVRTLESLA